MGSGTNSFVLSLAVFNDSLIAGGEFTHSRCTKTQRIAAWSEWPAYICGDINDDHAIDISDAVYLISYIFAGGPPPVPRLAGDVACDGIVDVSDAVYLVDFIFSGGPAPCFGFE